MSDSAEVRDLARAIAVHLKHLRDFRGLRYVSALPLPTSTRSADAPSEPLAQAVVAVAPEVSQPITVAGALPAMPDSARRVLPVAPSGATRESARTWTAAQKLEYLQHKNIGPCTRCALARTRSNIVFGVGDPEAALMFVGEAPGEDEDRRGEPFVGRAGQRLNEWLRALQLDRSDVYITNVLKCRPPGNRDPEPEEVGKCSPFLRAQIRAIQPRVLVALGRFAGSLLLGGGERTLRSMRGRAWTYEEAQAGLQIPVIVTYHPSYVLRQERDARSGDNEANEAVMADLRQALALVQASARRG